MFQGMTHSIQYTTIPDMRNRLDVGVQELSFAMSLGAAGGLFGGPMGSLVDRWRPRHSSAQIVKYKPYVIQNALTNMRVCVYGDVEVRLQHHKPLNTCTKSTFSSPLSDSPSKPTSSYR